MTTFWTAEHLASCAPAPAGVIPTITTRDRSGLDPARVYWDMWPLQAPDGMPARLAGRELWMALTAPDRGDPALRHFTAKIHWLERMADTWLDRGPVLPDFTVSYEREWAGSALLRDGVVTLFFTAAGTAEKPGGYQQSLWASAARLGPDGWPHDWSTPAPLIARPSPLYQAADAHEGAPGTIKALRDPAYFRDPADGAEYLAFTASLGGSDSAFNGAFGLARWQAGEWQLLPPLIAADGVNNELERAHLVYHRGRYYAFWSTQSHTFAPHLRHAPTGLYGMVADTLLGPYCPLNGSGLVLANPVQEPHQTYSWYVDADLRVSSFVDFFGLGGQDIPDDPATANAYFGGVPAPLLRLAIEDDTCQLVSRQEDIANARCD
ncbi:glycoside hydrolase family 68 protein [Erythrobacter sp. T5W1-R]|uniref:glycoside hydrolase family 68 protein n=1 Tax=Erythrobacter sp. T5W1-R TaxID=3101752 RepID=UPI002AFF16AF|nr:glycoside hydrolase family 68 protein [Erythrobacter sp. T5W1-R]MEA1619343.1 glycoside hydrolase family 68 protein [Erythrobacter sp. T5W1-R]